MNPAMFDLQKLYANMSHNTIDFGSYLNNTLLLSRQVANLIQTSFSSLGYSPSSPEATPCSEAPRQRPRVPAPVNVGGKRAMDYQNDISVKIENQALIQKRVKTNRNFETASDSTSEGSMDHHDLRVKFEEPTMQVPVQVQIRERVEGSISLGDQPRKIKGLKMDKVTKSTYYLVEWMTRPSGYKPQDRYVKSDEVLKSHGNLVAIFYELQLQNKISSQ